jgi:hypothetical protein
MDAQIGILMVTSPLGNPGVKIHQTPEHFRALQERLAR